MNNSQEVKTLVIPKCKSKNKPFSRGKKSDRHAILCLAYSDSKIIQRKLQHVTNTQIFPAVLQTLHLTPFIFSAMVIYAGNKSMP